MTKDGLFEITQKWLTKCQTGSAAQLWYSWALTTLLVAARILVQCNTLIISRPFFAPLEKATKTTRSKTHYNMSCRPLRRVPFLNATRCVVHYSAPWWLGLCASPFCSSFSIVHFSRCSKKSTHFHESKCKRNAAFDVKTKNMGLYWWG